MHHNRWLIIPIILIILAIATLIVLVRNIPANFFRDLTASLKKTGWNLDPQDERRTGSSGGQGGENGTVIAKPVPKPAPKPIPVFHSVRISSARETRYPTEFRTITLRGDVDAPIDVSGWKIQSSKDILPIPKAVAYFSSSRIGEPSDHVVLSRGVELALYSHTGITSNGFRTNKCMGYITRTTNFVPSLGTSCPSLAIPNMSSLTSRCQEYILRLGSCDVPIANPPVSPSDADCFDALKNINYAGCAELHKNDKDYLGNSWHIWLGNGGNRDLFDPLHDRIRLFDANGTLVDEYIY